MTVTIKRLPRTPEDPYGTTRIGSVRTFLEELEKIAPSVEDALYFRGHSNFTYPLRPSIYRNEGLIANEDILFKELILRCPNDFSSQESTFETLVRMQHYSLPTRLLDLTTNPLIALYFACQPGRSHQVGGEVVLLKIPKREIKYFDSDTVSVIANISRRPASFKIPEEFDRTKFNQEEEIRYLLHEIKHEKPYFEPLIVREHLQAVVCVKPKMDNPRIIRQDGAFLLFGVSGAKSEPAELPTRFYAEDRTRRIIVIPHEKQKILSQLAAFGVNAGTVYPEIERVAEYLKSVYETKPITT